MLRIEFKGWLTEQQLNDVMALKKEQRQRLQGQLARKIRVFTRKRLRDQRNIGGAPWDPRKSGKGKMLKGFSKKLQTKSGVDEAIIHFGSGPTGNIATAQQEGEKTHWDSAKAKRLNGTPNYNAPATKGMARALREAGFKIRRENGKGWKSPSLKWITENLKLGQAGLILKELRGDASKDSWTIMLPSRSFLGVSPGELRELTQFIVDYQLAKYKRA